MTNFLGLMKQAAELKTKMEAMQAELDQIEVEGSAGGNLVTVKINAKGELKAVAIDASGCFASASATSRMRRGSMSGSSPCTFTTTSQSSVAATSASRSVPL